VVTGELAKKSAIARAKEVNFRSNSGGDDWGIGAKPKVAPLRDFRVRSLCSDLQRQAAEKARKVVHCAGHFRMQVPNDLVKHKWRDQRYKLA
jgi:hypothetical protein